MKTQGLLAVVVLSGAVISPCVQAADQGPSDVSVSVGSRVWYSQWSGSVLEGGKVSDPRGGTLDAVSPIASKYTAAVIPFVALRYRDFGVSASTLLKKTYSFSDPVVSFDVDRREWDLNGLYYFLPSVSASLGYKHMSFGATRIKGPIIGLSGSAPVSGNFGVYGTAGLGRFKTDTGVATLNNAPVNNGAKTNYSVVEFGLSYALGSFGTALKGLNLTVGYRAQTVEAKGIIPLTNSLGRPTVYSDSRDTMRGMTVGIVGTF